MKFEQNTSQEENGSHNLPEGLSDERLAQQHSPRQSVEQRAIELARIEGRLENDVREEDREKAEKELAFGPSELSTPPASPEVHPAYPAVDAPQSGISAEDDEQLIAEEQARQGNREAEHETMLSERDEEERLQDELR